MKTLSTLFCIIFTLTCPAYGHGSGDGSGDKSGDGAVATQTIPSPAVAATTPAAGAAPLALVPPMLAQGTVTLQDTALTVRLLRSSGTVAQLSTATDPAFDYTPGDLLTARARDTYYHLGDLDLRLRLGDSGPWQDYSTAYRRQPLQAAPTTEPTSHTASLTQNLASTLPANIPVSVIRTWAVNGSELTLRYTLTNRVGLPVHLGGVGIPMVFNNIMNGRTLEQSYARCSLYDPYIGQGAGYVQVVRLTGTGPVLLVAPLGSTPLEAWKPILDKFDKGDKATGEALLLNDPTPRGITFEGSFDWMVHSAGFAETEWKGVQQWNPPTEAVLAPGASVTYGLRFFVAPSVRAIEATLAEHRRPVAIGVPGYILPQDMPGRLFLRYGPTVASIVSEPAAALAIHDDGPAQDPAWHAYTLRGVQWGRARLRITYTDGTVQSIGYRTIKSETAAVADMGRFLFKQQWFADPNDPFHRSPSVISYDNSTGAQITEEPRVWIAGLSDEAGAGSWIAAALKEQMAPQPDEVRKLEDFVTQTLWGQLQVSEGAQKYGVHKSLFYYNPTHMPPGTYNPADNWKTWTSWSPKDAADLGRSFNYAHVVAAYWSLYRIARNSTGLATEQSWQWYLQQAFATTMATETQAPYYMQFGQMEGTVYVKLLADLKAEGWTAQAAQMEAYMHTRAEHWRTEAYPFGSEMPWDSTGQEEVYDWTRYFSYDDKADVTLNAILAYTPVEPSWGYNGSARRYWDFLYGGKYERIERQLHHYGSGLNAIPLLAEYRRHPDDLYLLRAGYGGVMGPLANIDEKGFASAAFHSFPDKMQYDPYSGDYGPNFLGHALNTGAYLVYDARFGWLAFGGTVTITDRLVHMQVLDSARSRVFIASIGLWLTLDAGTFRSVDLDKNTHALTLHLAPATASVQNGRLHIETTLPGDPTRYAAAGMLIQQRGAIVIPLHTSETVVRLHQASASAARSSAGS